MTKLKEARIHRYSDVTSIKTDGIPSADRQPPFLGDCLHIKHKLKNKKNHQDVFSQPTTFLGILISVFFFLRYSAKYKSHIRQPLLRTLLLLPPPSLQELSPLRPLGEPMAMLHQAHVLQPLQIPKHIAQASMEAVAAAAHVDRCKAVRPQECVIWLAETIPVKGQDAFVFGIAMACGPVCRKDVWRRSRAGANTRRDRSHAAYCR
jgi:hypothetical protein